MSVLSKLLPASFRGVNFLVASLSVEQGRKTSIKEYPLSNRRLVEDLGPLPPTFTVDATVHGDQNTYFERLNRLKGALNQPGTGELIVPEEGSITVSVSTYTISTSQKNLGRSNFRITFLQSSSNVQPTPNSNLVGTINNQSDVVFETIKNDFVTNYNVSPQYKNNYLASLKKLNKVYELFKNSTSGFVNNEGFINNYFSDLEKFKQDIPSIVSNPQAISDQIVALFNSANNLGLTAQQRFDLSKEFYDFGNDDTPIQIPTAEINERNTNDSMINQLVQLGGLNQSYRNTPQVNYVTDDQLEVNRSVVIEQFNDSNQNLNIASNTLFQLENNRDLVTEFFRLAEANVFNIAEIETKEIPLTKLTYLLYEELMNYDQLLDLNNIKDPSFVSGVVKVLSM